MTKHKLTWDRKGRRWKKKYRGRQLYLSPRGGRKDDWAAYRRALQQYERMKVKIDQEFEAEQDQQAAIAQRERMIDWWLTVGRDRPEADEAIAHLRRELELVKQTVASGEQPDDPMDAVSMQGRAVWADRLASVEQRSGPTFEKALEDFLDFKAGDVKAGRFYNLREHLAIARLTLPARLDEIDSRSWETLYTHLTKRYSPNRAADVQATTRQFLQWCYDTDRLDKLPRNFKSRQFKIKRRTSRVLVFTAEEIKAIMAASTDEEKLWWLLMINCGFTQADVGSLKPDEVDWRAGTITRKRTKLLDNDSEHVPIVKRHLWPVTLTLLCDYGHRRGERVLTNANGGPLWLDTLEGQSRRRIDTIAQRWRRRIRENGIAEKGKSIKTFRKTGTTILAASKDFAHLTEIYLGNSPRGTTARHYSGVEELPAAATGEIGRALGLLG